VKSPGISSRPAKQRDEEPAPDRTVAPGAAPDVAPGVAPPAAPGDLELIEQHRRGEARAFETLVKRYQRRVYCLAYGIVHNPEDAMDVSQEAFVKVHRYLDKFEGSASFYTWLYRIVVNLCIDHLRRTSKACAVEYDDAIDRSQDVLAAADIVPSRQGSDPSQVLRNKETLGHIRAGLAELTPNHRAVIVMRELEGLSYKEMAKIMECSKGTIMSRLFHARKRLQAYLIIALNEDPGETV
jgi:RNA polymerase sigma-70 factor (ECF subfamily)